MNRGLRVGIAGTASQPSNCDSISSVHIREASPVLRPEASTIPLLLEVLHCATTTRDHLPVRLTSYMRRERKT